MGKHIFSWDLIANVWFYRGKKRDHTSTMLTPIDIDGQEDMSYSHAVANATNHWDQLLDEQHKILRTAQLEAAQAKKTIEVAKKRKASEFETVQGSFEKKYRQALSTVEELKPFFGKLDPVVEEDVPVPVCVVCMDRPRNAAFSKCHHVVCCMTCAQIIMRDCPGSEGHRSHIYYECPVCRVSNRRVQKVFF
jgi:hypothetical protein